MDTQDEAISQEKPLAQDKQPLWTLVVFWTLVIFPPVLVLLAGIYAWGGFTVWSLSFNVSHIIIGIVIGIAFYLFTGLGVAVGFHRYFTHLSFKAEKPWLKAVLAVAGSMAIEGNIFDWVSTHRKHHKFTDIPGDPHSPWRYGESRWGLIKGFLFAHLFWMGKREIPPPPQDLVDDEIVSLINRMFAWLAVASILLPAVIGGLITMSWEGAISALFWGSVIRISLLHHVTWSINSVCHMFGEKPFNALGGKATNAWWLAIPSFGEAWHNLHHADPTCARHGVLKGQIDMAAWVIKKFEDCGWVHSVRWPNSKRLVPRLNKETKVVFSQQNK